MPTDVADCPKLHAVGVKSGVEIVTGEVNLCTLVKVTLINTSTLTKPLKPMPQTTARVQLYFLLRTMFITYIQCSGGSLCSCDKI